ncbi:MAG: MFS transporter, partial [Acidimicrobiales bacterium]
MARVDVEGLTRRQRIVILAICCTSLLIVSLDNTIVNVALPSIGRDLHTSFSGLAWVVDAYTLVIASMLIFSGSIADRFGRRRVFQIGLTVFSLGSLLCSLAPSIPFLAGFRVLQGLGGSMLNPVALSIITNVFTDPKERVQAIGVWGAVIGIGLAAGPIVGGALVSSAGWQSIFWINVPVGLAAMVLAGRMIPESRANHVRGFDPLGQLVAGGSLGLLTFTIIEGPRIGWGSGVILATGMGALLGFVLFVRYERRCKEPLIDLRYFRSAPFTGANIIAMAAFGGIGGFLFTNTVYLQDVRHLSALHAGIDTLPMAIMTGIMPPIAGRLVALRGTRIPLIAGGICLTLGGLGLVQVGPATSFTWLFVSYAIFGIGFGLVNAPITNVAVSGMPRAQAGVAAAIASTNRQVGQTLGVAIAGAFAATAASRGVEGLTG